MKKLAPLLVAMKKLAPLMVIFFALTLFTVGYLIGQGEKTNLDITIYEEYWGEFEREACVIRNYGREVNLVLAYWGKIEIIENTVPVDNWVNVYYLNGFSKGDKLRFTYENGTHFSVDVEGEKVGR